LFTPPVVLSRAISPITFTLSYRLKHLPHTTKASSTGPQPHGTPLITTPLPPPSRNYLSLTIVVSFNSEVVGFQLTNKSPDSWPIAPPRAPGAGTTTKPSTTSYDVHKAVLYSRRSSMTHWHHVYSISPLILKSLRPYRSDYATGAELDITTSHGTAPLSPPQLIKPSKNNVISGGTYYYVVSPRNCGPRFKTATTQPPRILSKKHPDNDGVANLYWNSSSQIGGTIMENSTEIPRKKLHRTGVLVCSSA
jgi:hypothetical protein